MRRCLLKVRSAKRLNFSTVTCARAPAAQRKAKVKDRSKRPLVKVAGVIAPRRRAPSWLRSSRRSGASRRARSSTSGSAACAPPAARCRLRRRLLPPAPPLPPPLPQDYFMLPPAAVRAAPRAARAPRCRPARGPVLLAVKIVIIKLVNNLI